MSCQLLGYLHLSVSIFVGVSAALALPPQFLELGLAAFDGLRFGPALTLVLFQSSLKEQKKNTEMFLLDTMKIKLSVWIY